MFTKHIPRFQLVPKTPRKVMNSFVNTVHVSTRVWLARHSERWIPQNRCFNWLSCTLQITLLEASVKDLYTSRSQDFSTTLVHTWHRSDPRVAFELRGRRILQINSRDFPLATRTRLFLACRRGFSGRKGCGSICSSRSERKSIAS